MNTKGDMNRYHQLLQTVFRIRYSIACMLSPASNSAFLILLVIARGPDSDSLHAGQVPARVQLR